MVRDGGLQDKIAALNFVCIHSVEEKEEEEEKDEARNNEESASSQPFSSPSHPHKSQPIVSGSATTVWYLQLSTIACYLLQKNPARACTQSHKVTTVNLNIIPLVHPNGVRRASFLAEKLKTITVRRLPERNHRNLRLLCIPRLTNLKDQVKVTHEKEKLWETERKMNDRGTDTTFPKTQRFFVVVTCET